MSLIKNGDYVKITTLDSVPGNTSYKIKEYVDLNGNRIYPFKFSNSNEYLSTLKLKLKDTVIIKGNFGNYQGYLFSDWSPSLNTNMCIFKSVNNKIIWFIGPGSDTVNNEQVLRQYCSIDAEKGVHLYGFSDGKPFYDNQILEPSNNAYLLSDQLKEQYFRTGKDSTSFFGIGSANTGYKIYRIIIEVSEDKKTYSYYPCSDGTNIKIYEALQEENFCAIERDSGLESSSPSVPSANIKYGVSIDDVKSVTGSRYRDLMAMMAEDSGNTYTIGGIEADNTYKIIDGQIQHEFAFALKDISIPENTTVSSGQLSSYKKGELIYGRRPKWNIWGNTFPYSIWNRPDSDYNGTYDFSKKVYAMYNLTEHWGKDGKVKLEWFKDYCEADDNRPQVAFINSDGTDAKAIKINYHNGVVCNCCNDTMIPGLCKDASYGSHSSLLYEMLSYMLAEHASIYVYDNTLPDSSVWMKLGNLINWNASQLTQYNADKVGQVPTMNQMVYGSVATLTHSFRTLVDIGGGLYPTYVDILIGYATEQTRDTQTSTNQYLRDLPFISLSSESSQETKTKFRDGLVNGNKLRCEKLRATGNEPMRLYNEILSSVNALGVHIYKIEARGSMALLKRPEEISETETPRESDLVYLNKFIAPTKLDIFGKIDENELNISDLLYYIEHEFENHSIVANTDKRSSWAVHTDNSLRKMRLIFMNIPDKITDDHIEYDTVLPAHCDKLYTINSNYTVDYYYFFPIGFEDNSFDSTRGHSTSHYKLESTTSLNKGGLFIPFTLTNRDFTTYQKLINNYSGSNRTYVPSNNTYPTLRLIAEVTENIDLGNGEYEVKKDRISKLTFRRSEVVRDHWEYTLDEGKIYVSSNYLDLNISNENTYIAYIDPEDLPVICGTRDPETELITYSNSIPSDITVKFWIENNNYASTILTYGREYGYNYINDSWYTCIFGDSLYVFIKDLQNNEWKSEYSRYQTNENWFTQVISHWLYGKKANVFKWSNGIPTKLASDVGDYSNPLPSGTTWNDSLTAKPGNNYDLYMSERFYAKCWNPDDKTTNIYKYTHYIESTLFSDLEWSDPVKIKDDNDNKLFKVVIFCESEEDRQTVKLNPLDYVKYIEDEGFYGIEKTIDTNTTIVTYTFKAKKYDDPTNTSYWYCYCYYDEDNILRYYQAQTYHSGWIRNENSLERPELLDYALELYLTTDRNLIAVFEQSYMTINDFYETHDNVTGISSEYSYNIEDYESEYHLDQYGEQYKINKKYMFSKTSSLSPEDEPDKWDTLDVAITNSPTDYKFMYSEYYIFDVYGMFYKVFNIIQIKGDLSEDLYYPILLKDKDKLLTAYRYLSNTDDDSEKIRKNWYYVGQSKLDSELNYLNVFVGEGNIPVKPHEILAPYKINGLNVAIRDIVLAQIVYEDLSYNDGSTIHDKKTRFSITAPNLMQVGNNYRDVPKYYVNYIINLN